jgi:hypothetical protein
MLIILSGYVPGSLETIIRQNHQYSDITAINHVVIPKQRHYSHHQIGYCNRPKERQLCYMA